MARRLLIRTADFPYHIIARTNNKEWFYISMDHVWDLFNELLSQAKKKYQFDIIVSVLMNNHFHLMAYTPNCNIDVIMRHVMKNMADKINKHSNRMNHVFGGPYGWTIISNKNYYLNVIRYIAQNPLRAGICNDIRQYKYLSINWEKLDLIQHNQSIHIHHDQKIDYINWFNQVPSLKESEAIRKGLKREKLDTAIDSKSRKKIQFDSIS